MKGLSLAPVVALAVVFASCGHHDHRAKSDAGVTSTPPAKVAAPVADFPASTVSLRLTSAAAIRLEPNDEAKRIGTIEQETRVVGYFSKVKNWNKSKRFGELLARQRGRYRVETADNPPQS